MALTLAAAATLAVDPVWVGKIKVAMYRAAVAVIASVFNTNPPYNNVQRAKVVKARQVLQDVDGYGSQMAWLMAADTVLDQTNATDAEIAARLVQLWFNFSETGFGTD